MEKKSKKSLFGFTDAMMRTFVKQVLRSPENHTAIYRFADGVVTCEYSPSKQRMTLRAAEDASCEGHCDNEWAQIMAHFDRDNVKGEWWYKGLPDYIAILAKLIALFDVALGTRIDFERRDGIVQPHELQDMYGA